MPTPPGKTVVGAYVDRSLAERFAAWARREDGGVSGAIRRFVESKVADAAPYTPPGAAGYDIMVRLKEAERIALLRAAEARGTTPANWLRSLAVVHLSRQPQWRATEAEGLRAIGMELRRIGNNLNQMARALNTAAHTGDYPPFAGEAATEAAESVRAELRRLMAIYTGNFDLWGLPEADRPTAAPDMEARELARQAAAKAKRRLRPRRRPAVFGGNPHAEGV